MRSKIQEILGVADNKRRRATLYDEAYSTLEQYENVEAISLLGLALWKGKLKSGWSSDASKRRALLERGECRCVCGSDIVVPNVIAILLV